MKLCTMTLLSCSRRALALAGFVCLCFVSTCEAELTVVNGMAGTNLLFIATEAGLGRCAASTSLAWPEVEQPATNYFGLDGVTNGSWISVVGHSYSVVCDGFGNTRVLDVTPSTVRWFWYGISVSMCLGIGGLGARWTRKAIGGGINE